MHKANEQHVHLFLERRIHEIITIFSPYDFELKMMTKVVHWTNFSGINSEKMLECGNVKQMTRSVDILQTLKYLHYFYYYDYAVRCFMFIEVVQIVKVLGPG